MAGPMNRMKKDSVNIHVIGIWFILMCTTFPDQIKIIKMIGSFPLRISDILAVYLLFANLSNIRFRKPILSIFFLLILSYATYIGIVKSDAGLVYQDLQGLIYILFTIEIMSQVKEKSQLVTLSKYFIGILWFSSLVILLGVTGILSLSFKLRAFSDTPVPGTVGRLVTNTMGLSWAACFLTLALFFIGDIKFNQLIYILIPVTIILIVSGSRLSLIFVVSALLIILFPRHFDHKISKDEQGKFYKMLLFFFAVILIPLIGQRLGIIEYLGETMGRFKIFFGNDGLQTDSSIKYRVDEISRAVNSFMRHPFLGYGFGVPYTEVSIAGAKTGWLAQNGNLYTHEAVLWLLLKVGVVGTTILTVLLGGTVSSIKVKNTYQKIFKILLFSFLLTGLAWNVVTDIVAASIIGSIIGILGSGVLEKA